jgi:hypothetical protein
MLQTVVKRKPTSKAMTFRLTEVARLALAEFAERDGVDMTATLELLLRQELGRRGIPIEGLREKHTITSEGDDEDIS